MGPVYCSVSSGWFVSRVSAIGSGWHQPAFSGAQTPRLFKAGGVGRGN